MNRVLSWPCSVIKCAMKWSKCEETDAGLGSADLQLPSENAITGLLQRYRTGSLLRMFLRRSFLEGSLQRAAPSMRRTTPCMPRPRTCRCRGTPPRASAAELAAAALAGRPLLHPNGLLRNGHFQLRLWILNKLSRSVWSYWPITANSLPP